MPENFVANAVRTSASFTKAAGVTAYAPGDVVSTTAGAIMEFLGCAAKAPGGTGVIVGAQLVVGSNDALKLSAELWLFNTPPAAVADNAPFAPTAAELANLTTVIPLSLSFVGNAGAGVLGNAAYLGYVDAGGARFICAPTTRSLYGVLVARNAYIPITLGVFTVTLFIEQH